ncbi:putative leucine-rich repeat receptor-like protein kinase At2g19210 [Pistacia vera]|uniref:putative leucine-rich repeat receptor-like protein kinase At2g19210 n=1 Tax=Pistacia vera TaxID=55513 RepID=UPI00126313AB|nr:putative leucine-rich repeat receptor-like protein kinase At2g19210 [Pistacia vera]
MVEKLQSFHYALLAGFTLAVLIHAQDQSGFISIDCGLPEGSDYTDDVTGIKYTSDKNFTDTGISWNITSSRKTISDVRSFPEGNKNCYTLNPAQGKNGKYLIRARFMYGNYDCLASVPRFDLYIGANHWETISLENASSILTTEIIHAPSTDYIFVCLINKGLGVPFISALELRPLNSSLYETESPTESLVLLGRYDFGPTTNQPVRYIDDIYDRIWTPQSNPDLKILSPSITADTRDLDSSTFQAPISVMSTAVTPENADENLNFSWEIGDPNSRYYSYKYFAEVEFFDNQTREFDIYENGDLKSKAVSPSYLLTETTYTTKPFAGEKLELQIRKTQSSDLPPIINAIEIYKVKDSSRSQTLQTDADAIVQIKSTYQIKKTSWQGDPCTPEKYSWESLNCSSYVDNIPPRIISLDLSSSRLTGEISPFFADLTFLEDLNLSDNNLTGAVPDFLSRLPSLRVLNLKGNKFTGSVPAELKERSDNGSLVLSLDDLSSSSQKKNGFVIPLVVSVAATFSALIIGLAIFCSLKARRKHVVSEVETQLASKNDSFASKHWRFAYSDVIRITKNFATVLGRGGFGTVYHGRIDNIEVAVKMLSPSSAQGYKEFHAEVELLMRVHHRNLIALVGYCIEGFNMGLIYEYMPRGTLEQHLAGNKNQYFLSWEERMQIALDAAQGLEYLHNGCKPPMVHRDVEPSNILLNEKLQAKIADFGLSRVFSTESSTSISTAVAGTAGYLDPECLVVSSRLTEKSDVYSFGLVLLNIITCQPVILKSCGNTHISEWVKSRLARGDIRKIVDPRLGEIFNINSAWKAVELALASASHASSKRPTMTEVVMGLKECLAIQLGQNDYANATVINGARLDSEFAPLAR